MSIMTDPAPMHTHYSDTVDFDWSTHFQRQSDSGMSVEQYCKLNRCSTRTWYRIKKQYNECIDKTQFKHTKKRTGIDPLLSSSGEKYVSDKLERTTSGTVNSGIIKQTVVKRLFDKYQCGPENLTRHCTYKLMKNVVHIKNTSHRVSGTLNTHKNVNHYFTLLNTITANVEYAADYLLTRFKRDIIPYCFHWVAHGPIDELRIRNNIFTSYNKYHTIEAFNAQYNQPM